jgi:hypothetical protein
MLSFERVGNAAYRDVPGVYVRYISNSRTPPLTCEDAHRGP